MMKSIYIPLICLASAGAAIANVAPTVTIQSATMRPDSTLMDVVYQITDPDDATVKTRALAFVDGVRSFANVLRPVTFAEGTEANLGDAIATGVDHTLTWNVAADWSIDLGQVKFEVLAMDGRGLLPIDWIALPAAGGNPALTISKDGPSDDEVLDALFWQYASGDADLELADGTLSATASAGIFGGMSLVAGSNVENEAAAFLLRKMDRKLASVSDLDFATSARANPLNLNRWHALDEAYDDSHTLVISSGSFSFGDTPTGLTDTVAASVSRSHTLVLSEDGIVSGWGSGRDGSAGPPSPGFTATAIAVGRDFSVALKEDGTVVAWGDDIFDKTTVPAGLSGVTAIAAGDNHALALKDDGTVVGWGETNGATPPAGLTDVIAIAAGERGSLAVRDDGTVVAWGPFQTPPPAGLTNVAAVALGRLHSIALKDDGTVVGWGSNPSGDFNPPAGLAGVVQVAAGFDFSLAVKDNGEVVAWGARADSAPETLPPAGLTNVVGVSAAFLNYTLVLQQPAE